MTDDIQFPVTATSGICQDCKHLAPRLRIYGNVTICHTCVIQRQRVQRGDEPIVRRRATDAGENTTPRDRRCTDCQTRERDGRHWGDAYLCLTCENTMLERIDHPPVTVEHDRIPA